MDLYALLRVDDSAWDEGAPFGLVATKLIRSPNGKLVWSYKSCDTFPFFPDCKFSKDKAVWEDSSFECKLLNRILITKTDFAIGEYEIDFEDGDL